MSTSGKPYSLRKHEADRGRCIAVVQHGGAEITEIETELLKQLIEEKLGQHYRGENAIAISLV